MKLIASHLRDFADFLPENKRADFNATIDDLLVRAEVAPKWTPTEDEMQFARDIVGTPGFYTGAAVLVAKALLRLGMNEERK